MSSRLSSARRIAIKIGSALLVEQSTGELKRSWLASLVNDVAGLKAGGADVLIVWYCLLWCRCCKSWYVICSGEDCCVDLCAWLFMLCRLLVLDLF